jgi:Na+/melibiose symporter-like transporter
VAGFRATTGLVVCILFVLCTVLLCTYQLNKQATIQMADELAERRLRAAQPSVLKESYEL